MRTIYRDIDSISLAGIPVVTYQGQGGGIGLAPGYRIDRNLLTRDELVSVFTALRAATTYSDRHAGAILEKLRVLVPEARSDSFQTRLQHTVIDLRPWGNTSGLHRKLKLLQEAAESLRTVSLLYCSTRGESTRREVEPHVLLLRAQHWYLYGFCRMRQSFRLFKLSRIQEVVLLDDRFERVPLNLEEAPWDQAWESPSVVDLHLRFHPSARVAVIDFFGAENLPSDSDRWFEMRISFPEDDWVYGFLLSFGPKVEVLGPPSVRERIRRMTAETCAIYSKDAAMAPLPVLPRHQA